MKSILVLAAHPDDEVFDRGGMIATLVKEGVMTDAAFLADGVFSLSGDSEAPWS